MNTVPKIKISVLDQSPIRSGGSPTESLLETVELAKACERFGYHRYWLASDADFIFETAHEAMWQAARDRFGVEL